MTINIVIVDEAQRVTPGSFLAPEDLAFHPLVQAVNQGRKLRIGMTFIAQRPSAVNSSFLAQSGLILAGPLSNEDDIRAVRTAMGLDQAQLDFYRQMPQRVFLMKRTGSNVFPIVIPRFSIKPIEATKDFVDWWNAGVISRSPLPLRELFFRPEKQKKMQEVVEKDDAYFFLEVINDNPGFPISHYANLLKDKFQLQKFYQQKQIAEEQGWILCHQIPTGRSHVIGIEILEKALEKFQLKKKFHCWRGSGFVHSWLAENVRRSLQAKGKTVIREKRFGDGRFADLFIPEDNMAVEIAVGNKAEIETNGILEDLKFVQSVIVISNSKDHLEDLQKKVKSENVTFKLFSNFKG